jgi:integrating conjugative element protein (TIGR03746 family)
MNSVRNKLIAATEHIKTLRVLLCVFLLCIIALWLRNGSLQESRRIYIPPDLTQGAIVQFDNVPPPVVYTFSSYIFQQLNRWKEDGEDDYQSQIFKLQGYLTPSCIAFLTEDMNTKSQLGELRSRVRMIEESSNDGYTRQRVLIETPQSWIVWLDFNIRETISGHPVKNIHARYQLRVVKFDVDKEVNPWGLAIACDDNTTPVLLTDKALEQPFRQQENMR